MIKHKCVDCGFITLRNRETRELVEAEDQFRQTGTLRLIGRYETMPVCFVNSLNIAGEVEIIRKSVNDEPQRDAFGEIIPPHWDNHIKVVLNVERECRSFLKWQQGFTPKEHREMMDREKMLEWQLKREESDRKWRSKQDWKLIIIAGIFTIIGAIIGAIISH